MKLKNISKQIIKFDYGELALLIIILIKTLRGVITMNFKQINKPNVLVTTIFSLNIVWVLTDVSNIKIYPIHVLLVDIGACIIFLYYFIAIKFKKSSNYNNYINVGITSLVYSMIVSVETIVMADTVSLKVFLISCFSCLMFGLCGIILSNSKYMDN